MSNDPHYLFDTTDVDIQDMQLHTQVWRSQQLAFVWKDETLYELTNEEASPIFERLMALNAITTNPDSLGLSATPDEYDRLVKLEELGIV